MNKTNNPNRLSEYIRSKEFLKQILLIAVAFVLLLLVIQLCLRFYTNHGQKLQLPKFIGMQIDDAILKAENGDFEVIIADSIFVVGQNGGLITDQNPKPLAYVKEGRKVYVTVTKYGVETLKVSELPTMYGNAFDQKKTELKYRDIDCVIKDYAYDPGEPNHILEVWYNGELIISKDVRKEDVEISKGSSLECILSRKDGGDVLIPDLRCLSLEEAGFLLQSSKLEMGDVIKENASEPDAILFVVAQSPPFDGISNIKMGDKVVLTVSQVRPSDCN
jgi:UDP-N-acetylmuramate--alanine ligase